MTVTAEFFISPPGDLTEDMFPGEDLEDRVDGYLNTVTARYTATITDADKLERAIIAGVFVRAYRAAASIAVGQPIQGTLMDQGSIQYAQDRAEQFLNLAQMYQNELDGILTSLVTEVTTVRHPSGAVATRFTAP